MGNFILSSTLKNYDFYNMHSVWQQWETLSDNESYKISKTVKNRKNNSILGQLYQTMRVENLQVCLKILQFRKTYRQSSIVGIFGVYLPSSEQKNSFAFCGQLQNYSLVTQKVAYCFSDIGLIEFPNAIHILKKVLSAAKLIKQKLNLTTLYDENMIFFNTQNNCKIWINENISKNQLMNSNQISEFECILSIFTSVESKINYSPDFEKYLQMKSQISFTNFMDAINFINSFQQKPLKLANYQENIAILNLNQKNESNTSQVKAQKIKKSLSSRKKILQIQNNQKFLSTKKTNQNFQNVTNKYLEIEKSQVLSKFKQNIPSNFYKQEGKSFQSILGAQNFSKDGTKKKQQLKKHKINSNQIKQKYNGLASVDLSMIQKPLSLVSTNHQSFDNQSNYGHFNDKNQNLNRNINKIQDRKNQKNQVKESIFLSPRTLNMKTQNSKVTFVMNSNTNSFRLFAKQKLSISQYNSKLKKNISVPIFFKSQHLVCS